MDKDSVEPPASSISAASPTAASVLPTPQIEPTLTPTYTAAPGPSPILAASPLPSKATSPSPVSEAALYELIAPSVAFIETPIIDGGKYFNFLNGKIHEVSDYDDYTFTGSGVLIEGGYIIASYKVVWPYDAVRVVFPDGSEFEDVPVVNLDPLAGLAVLGPIDTPARPLMLANGEDTALGSPLYLIVYPEENEEFPQPVIGHGRLQTLWETERSGITYFETDIAVADGHTNEVVVNTTDTVSGGALVNDQGELIGVSVPVPYYERHRLTLAASASDISPIATRLIKGETRPELSDRRVPSSEGQFEFDFKTRRDWETHWRGDNYYGWPSDSYYRRFLVQEPVGTMIEIELTGQGRELDFYLVDAQGKEDRYQRYHRTVTETDHQFGSVELKSNGPHFLMVQLNPDYRLGERQFSDVKLRSNVKLIPLYDPDDGREISVGVTIVGTRDMPGDRDWFTINLKEGETVQISAESVASLRYSVTIDVDFLGSRENQRVHDDGGGGARGADNSIVYRAPHAGEFFIDVSAGGGYYLSVEKAPTGAEPIFIPPSPRVEGEVEGPFGPMTVYKSALGGFSIQVPADWHYGYDEKHSPFAEFYGAYSPDGDKELRIGFDNESIAQVTPPLNPLDVAAWYFTMWAAPNILEDEVVSRDAVQTSQGIPSERIVLSYGGSKIALATYYLADDRAAVAIAYYFPAEQFDKFKGLVNHSFSTFRVN